MVQKFNRSPGLRHAEALAGLEDECADLFAAFEVVDVLQDSALVKL